MAIRSPELILASYSWARRDHMVRLMRARPVSGLEGLGTTFGFSASLRMPTDLILASGTRSVILSLLEGDDEKLELEAGDLLLLDATTIRPTPWAG
jgi:hypothetical protein